jgi:hypothetical protein
MRKFNQLLSDRIEYKGVQLVNAVQQGRCARCDSVTLWYDQLTMQFLCSEECVEQAYLEMFERKWKGA